MMSFHRQSCVKIYRVSSTFRLLPTKIGQLWVGGMSQPFCALKKVTRDVAKLDGKIVECRFDFEQRGWIFLRERTDKSFPNAYSTAEGKK